MRRFQSNPRALLPIVVVLAMLAAGCGSGNGSAADTSSSTVTATGGIAHVVMKALAFNPGTVEAKVGQTVAWANEDSSPHNVTYVSGPLFKSSGTLKPGARFSITLTQPGTIHYFCTIHPWMKGTIVVSR